jgi:hypothetical protein
VTEELVVQFSEMVELAAAAVHTVTIVSQLFPGRVTRLQLEVQGKQVRWVH